MTKTRFLFFFCVVLSGWPQLVLGKPAVRPLLGYEYATSLDGYISHGGRAGVKLNFRNRFMLSGTYSALSDSDYQIIHTGTFRARKEMLEDLDLGAALLVSGGELKENQGSLSSFSLDFEATRYFNKNLDWANGYRYTEGSLTFNTVKEAQVSRRRRIETIVVEERESSHYVLHTLTSSVGIGSLLWLPDFYTAFTFAGTFGANRASSFSEGAEISYRFPHEFYVGLSYTLTQSVSSAGQGYLGLSLSKIF